MVFLASDVVIAAFDDVGSSCHPVCAALNSINVSRYGVAVLEDFVALAGNEVFLSFDVVELAYNVVSVSIDFVGWSSYFILVFLYVI